MIENKNDASRNLEKALQAQCFRYLRNGIDNVRPALAVQPAVFL